MAQPTYTLNDWVAAVFAKTSIDDLGFRGDDLREATAMVQRADPEELKKAAIVTVKTRKGFMRHLMISDLDGDPAEFVKLLKLKRGFDTCRKMIGYLKRKQRVVQQENLLTIVQEILKQVQKRLEQDALLKTRNEAY